MSYYFSFFYHFVDEELEDDLDEPDWFYHDREFAESFEEDDEYLEDEEESLLMNDADALNTFDEYTACSLFG